MGYAEDNAKLAVHLPSDELEVSEENLHLFFQTMFERQEIWYKRFILKKEKPWTENEIFRDYKFTNVYRELDRNSQYQIEHVFKKIVDKKDRKELIWRIMFFRFFNNPEFFEFIKDEGYFPKIVMRILNKDSINHNIIPDYNSFDGEVLKRAMEDFREVGGNPFTNAYLTNSQACPGWTRDECFAFKVIPTLHELVPKINKTLLISKNPQEIIKLLLTLPSVSNFMAHEFYQDFTYAPRYSGIDLMKFDRNDYTNVGPGAEAGIRWIFPNRKTKKEKEQALYDLRDIMVDYLAEFGDFKYLGYDREKDEYFWDKDNSIVDYHMAEMWCCEFQKYKKMQLKIGKQRSKFIIKTNV